MLCTCGKNRFSNCKGTEPEGGGLTSKVADGAGREPRGEEKVDRRHAGHVPLSRVVEDARVGNVACVSITERSQLDVPKMAES